MNAPEKVEEYWKVETFFEEPVYGWLSQTDQIDTLAEAREVLAEMRDSKHPDRTRIVHYETIKMVVK